MSHLESIVIGKIIVRIEREDLMPDAAVVPSSSIALGMLHSSSDVRAGPAPAPNPLTMKRPALESV